jgi:glycosyltransferase involved in cell wall biosynthesis
LEKATGEWILQMDADEVVTPELAEEIKLIINNQKIEISPDKRKLFDRHQKLIEERDGKIGKTSGEIAGYFIPRINMFLGKPLIHGGVYPDGVIRLVKNGKAHFPQKSVHEQISLDGEVSWLSGNLLHYDSPTLSKYIWRLNRYTDLKAVELKNEKVSKNIFSFINYVIIKPKLTFLSLFFRHKGFLDGVQGFLWAFFSAMHFPIAYFKYLTNEK